MKKTCGRCAQRHQLIEDDPLCSRCVVELHPEWPSIVGAVCLFRGEPINIYVQPDMTVRLEAMR